MGNVRVASRESQAAGMTIKSFVDLRVWQSAKSLAVATYKVTKMFPKDEQFGLTNQVRRASTSIAANIAEGFGRRTVADRAHFYDIAKGSLSELQSHFIIAQEIGYLPKESFLELVDGSIECNKMLTGLISSTRNRDSRLATRDSKGDK